MPSVTVNADLFPSEKIININASDLFDAYTQYAKATKIETERVIDFYKNLPDYDKILDKSKHHLDLLLQVRKTHPDCFTTSDGVNHLENYLQAFTGFCQGSEISLELGALLQIELESGCQSLTALHHPTNSVIGLHTEEDDTAFKRFGSPDIGKFWITMKYGQRSISYMSYAGICAYGNTTTVLIEPNQVLFAPSDVLGPVVEGAIWANAVCFMILDCGNISLINELISNLNRLPPPKFFGGYIITPVECRPQPKMTQIEFGGNLITANPPESINDFSVHTGVNYPHNDYLQSIESYNNSADPEFTRLQEIRSIFEKRYQTFSNLISALKANDLNQPLLTITNMLLTRDGEWRQEWFTGFSNCYVASHSKFHIDSQGNLEIHLINGSPQSPVPPPPHPTS